MQINKQPFCLAVIIIALLFTFTSQGFAQDSFLNLAGTWKQVGGEGDGRTKVYITQSTSGKILEMSGMVYYYYNWDEGFEAQ